MNATIEMDGETYVRRGVQMPGMTCQEWADQFTALGGVSCRVGMPTDAERAAGIVTVRVQGAPEAVMFVCESTATDGGPERRLTVH